LYFLGGARFLLPREGSQTQIDVRLERVGALLCIASSKAFVHVGQSRHIIVLLGVHAVRTAARIAALQGNREKELQVVVHWT
jgi:hypothetical protein